jgi:hypothetical protein
MTTTVQAVLIFLGVTLIGAGLILTWRRASVRAATTAPRIEGESAGAGGELVAAPSSEAIEDLVNQRLAAAPGLSGTRVDFGTAADGSLEIWVGDERYLSVDEIRDPRIRQAVQDAVAAYNK